MFRTRARRTTQVTTSIDATFGRKVVCFKEGAGGNKNEQCHIAVPLAGLFTD